MEKFADVTVVAQGGYPEVIFHLCRKSFHRKLISFAVESSFVLRLSGTGSRLDILTSKLMIFVRV